MRRTVYRGHIDVYPDSGSSIGMPQNHRQATIHAFRYSYMLLIYVWTYLDILTYVYMNQVVGAHHLGERRLGVHRLGVRRLGARHPGERHRDEAHHGLGPRFSLRFVVHSFGAAEGVLQVRAQLGFPKSIRMLLRR